MYFLIRVTKGVTWLLQQRGAKSTRDIRNFNIYRNGCSKEVSKKIKDGKNKK